MRLSRFTSLIGKLSLTILLTAVSLVSAPAWCGLTKSCQGLFTKDKRPALYFNISREIGTTTNIDNGNESPFRITYIKHDDATYFLHDLKPQDIPPETQVEIRLRMSRKTVSINLSEEMNQRIVSYLRAGGPPSSPFDCNCFAHYMNGVGYIFGKFYNDKWVISTFEGNRSLKPGDTILIGKNGDDFSHLAIYLGHDLYLSKFGSIGPLLVTTLPAMILNFEAKRVVKITPSRPAK